MRPRRIRIRASKSRALLAGAALSAGSLGPVALFQASASASGALVGTFTITAGACSGGTVSGSYFRMILQGGNAGGPYLSNSDSSCSDQSYTPMAPGSDGGLESGVYQPQPSPAFDSHGNALASRIISPSNFYGVRYAASTQPTDPQTGLSVPAPEISVSGSSLSGTVQAVSVSWNDQYFNQGSPKPDGSSPGDTTPVTGTYDATTGAYTLQWTSQVVGGPFNGFSGLWHLTGRFVPASGASGASGPAGAPTGSMGRGSAPGLASPAGLRSSAPSSGPSGAAGAQVAGAAATQAAGSASATGGSVLATRTTRSSGLSPPTWAVALVIAAGVLALGAFVFLRGRRPLRIASAAVVAAALGTLGTFALWPASVTTTVTHHRAAAAAGSGATSTAPASLPAPSGVAAAVPATLASTASVPIATSGASGVAPAPPQTSPTGGGAPPAPAMVQCPLGLPAASNSGGLQSLVVFAPAFGPWSSEGFALAPAYAPLLQLFGPVIAQLVAQSPQAAPVLDPLLSTLQSLDTQGYTALSPLYGPYREQMLSAETQLASALAPYSEQLANSAAGSCLVDLESVLVGQAQP